MKIGSLTIENILIFAPMAGITNLPLRVLAKQAGCGLVCSEMISAKGLVQNAARTIKMLDSVPLEKPLSIQIFGADPFVMADAAARVEASGADIIDLNFGCSVKKIVKTGAGAALMKDPIRSAEIVKAVRDAVKIPLTIKMRSGWEESGDQAHRLSKIVQDLGADAVTIHPRTAKQGFTGKADWSLIARIKQTLNIPVIGNGDVRTTKDVRAMIAQTQCDAVMIGRAAIGDPGIFSRIFAGLNGRELPDLLHSERFDVMRRFVEASFAYLGEKQAAFMMRGRLGWFTKGLPHGSRFRGYTSRISTLEEALRSISDYEELLAMEADAVSGYPDRQPLRY
jgi:tRNA-dihydrouridine synthase B